jgi:glutamate dehydrogenase
MSDTSRAAVQRIRQESPTVDAVCRQLETSLPADEAPLVVHFAEIFFSKAPPDFIRGRSTETLAHLILAGFRFLERAHPGVVNVEVVNPEIENEGWTAPVTVLRTNVTERPFIVDTIREFLHSQGFVIEHYVYPVLHVERRGGKIVDVLPSLEGQRRESFVHCEIPRVLDPAAREDLRAEVATRLQDVVRATDDHHPMVNALNDVIAELAERARDLPKRRKELEEIQAFLRWLRDGAFVFLGYRAYDIVVDPKSGDRSIIVEPGSGMGILRNEAESNYADPVPLAQLREGLRDLVEGGPTLIISKTNAESTVHRRARMDYIGIKKIAENGEVVGEHRFTGLFTSRAYGEEADRIPILREKLQSILEAAGVQAGSHDYKEINTIFNSMPKEELFLTSAREIGADVQTVLTSYNTAGVRVSLRQDLLQRGVSALVILPKDKFSGEVRKSIESELVNAFEGEVLNYHLALGSGDQARLHFYMSAEPDRFRAVSANQLEQSVRELIRSWNDRLAEELERVLSEDEALRQAKRYGEAFNGEYRAATEPSEAVRDLLELETMQAQERNISIAFANKRESSAAPGVENVTELKVYLRGRRLVLSDFMPILEHVGLRVIAVNPFEVEGGGVEPAILYLFAVQDAKDSPLDVEKSAVLVADAILGVWAGDVSDDLMNSLVLTAGLHWREVDVLRCYASYAYQLGATPSRFALPSSLVRYPQIARIVFELFQIKFDPAQEQSLLERQEAAQEIRGLLNEAMRGVTALADDRALRRLITLVEATVRTNYYRSGGRAPTRRSGGVPYTSLKFACRQLESIVRNRLLYEVWVRSSRMEGIHLRGAKVSRGGIRWSDRPDDFRTEVLGLVKTQMVKNAVIVPAGSKGGFITLRQFGDAERTAEEGKEQYRTLIRGLLDITDNLDLAGKPAPPEDVLCFDDPDPYLVVAADKGTAKFSDVANALAAEYGFWMGDAFASGGSQGYDHKEVGITARGAWECVKRHFLEMGKDIQTEPFTVVGIGDMGGDVFGNGMLLSEQIRLIAAFDHRHVFIDPAPDPAISFKERQRLFALSRSTWNDYDRSLLSPGGMIVPRGAKEVTLTPEAKQALKIAGETPLLDGESLIRAVLRAPAELLWNGGIGTYVKASGETHSDAGDPSSDAVRISAPELRCEVVGEGGNLGFTQAARIEYALKGGHINTDALDNSGGVDLSDHEVNLKILLNPVVRSGKLEEAGRNELLEELTDDVAELVEADNRSQSLAISLDQLRAKGRESTEEFRDLMTSLEKAGVLDRAAEHLPTLEALVERQEAGGSLTRPELCTLLAYSKLSLMGALLRSTLPDDPAAETYLTSYFPPAATAAAGEEALRAHRLRREIIASQLTNDIVDLMGAAFVQRLVRSTGRTPADVTRAWMIAARLADHREVLQQVHSGEEPQPPVAEVYRWLLGLGRVLQRTSRWILQNVPPETKTADVMAANLEGLSELRRRFAEIVTGDDRKLFEQLVTEMRSLGAGESLAHSFITLRFLDQLLEILRVAKETGSDPIDTARAFYRVSDVLRVPWLRHAIFAAAENDRWEQRAANALADDLSRAHHRFVAEVMRARGGNGADVDRVTDGMLRSREREMMRFREVIEEIQQESRMSLSGLSVAVREIGVFCEQLNGSHTNN